LVKVTKNRFVLFLCLSAEEEPVEEGDEIDGKKDGRDNIDRVVDPFHDREVAPRPARVELGQGVKKRNG
jgi:hypothetical protein